MNLGHFNTNSSSSSTSHIDFIPNESSNDTGFDVSDAGRDLFDEAFSPPRSPPGELHRCSSESTLTINNIHTIESDLPPVELDIPVQEAVSINNGSACKQVKKDDLVRLRVTQTTQEQDPGFISYKLRSILFGKPLAAQVQFKPGKRPKDQQWASLRYRSASVSISNSTVTAGDSHGPPDRVDDRIVFYRNENEVPLQPAAMAIMHSLRRLKRQMEDRLSSPVPKAKRAPRNQSCSGETANGTKMTLRPHENAYTVNLGDTEFGLSIHLFQQKETRPQALNGFATVRHPSGNRIALTQSDQGDRSHLLVSVLRENAASSVKVKHIMKAAEPLQLFGLSAVTAVAQEDTSTREWHMLDQLKQVHWFDEKRTREMNSNSIGSLENELVGLQLNSTTSIMPEPEVVYQRQADTLNRHNIHDRSCHSFEQCLNSNGYTPNHAAVTLHKTYKTKPEFSLPPSGKVDKANPKTRRLDRVVTTATLSWAEGAKLSMARRCLWPCVRVARKKRLTSRYREDDLLLGSNDELRRFDQVLADFNRSVKKFATTKPYDSDIHEICFELYEDLYRGLDAPSCCMNSNSTGSRVHLRKANWRNK